MCSCTYVRTYVRMCACVSNSDWYVHTLPCGCGRGVVWAWRGVGVVWCGCGVGVAWRGVGVAWCGCGCGVGVGVAWCGCGCGMGVGVVWVWVCSCAHMCA